MRRAPATIQGLLFGGRSGSRRQKTMSGAVPACSSQETGTHREALPMRHPARCATTLSTLPATLASLNNRPDETRMFSSSRSRTGAVRTKRREMFDSATLPQVAFECHPLRDACAVGDSLPVKGLRGGRYGGVTPWWVSKQAGFGLAGGRIGRIPPHGHARRSRPAGGAVRPAITCMDSGCNGARPWCGRSPWRTIARPNPHRRSSPERAPWRPLRIYCSRGTLSISCRTSNASG